MVDALMQLAAAWRTMAPEAAATMYGHALLSSTSLGDFDVADEAAEETDSITEGLDAPVLSVEAAAALLDPLRRRPLRARERLRRCEALIEAIDPLSTEQLPLVVALCRFLDNDTTGALRAVEEITGIAQRAGAIGLQPFSCRDWP